MPAPARRTGADVVVPAVVVGLALAGLLVVPRGQPGFRDPDLVAAGLAVAQGLPLVVRRRAALWVLVTVWAATAVFLAVGYVPVSTALVAPAVATYAVAAYDAHAVRERAGLSVLLLVALVGIALVAGYSLAEGGALGLVFVTAWVAGDRARTRREHVETLEERAQLLERERQALLDAAAGAERTRIARELHDVVAHGVSVIVLHARGAKEVLATDPQATRRSLDLIEHTGRQALQELRTVVGALRTDQPDAIEPQVGLAHLDDLVGRTEAAGLSVTVAVEGPSSPLPTAVDLAAYRIVQEALANTLKHSEAPTARVTLRHGDDHLVVEVTDEGPSRNGPDPADGRGYGLVGMHERVSMLNGRLRAGHRPGGGYEVMAVLPVRSDRP